MYVTHRQRHNQAMLAPSSCDEKAIVQLLRGLQDYRELLDRARDSGSTSNTAVLAQGMAEVARGLLKLIDGPLGRLDAELVREELVSFTEQVGMSLVSTTEPASSSEQPIAAVQP